VCFYIMSSDCAHSSLLVCKGGAGGACADQVHYGVICDLNRASAPWMVFFALDAEQQVEDAHNILELWSQGSRARECLSSLIHPVSLRFECALTLFLYQNVRSKIPERSRFHFRNYTTFCNDLYHR
jgi:hypothetical protein